MTDNKFWLVWESDISYQTHKTQESAIKEARELAKNGDSPYYVLEATHSFKADVNVIETSFEATPEDSSVIEPKFKIGDEVLHQDNKEFCGVSWRNGVVIDIIYNKYVTIKDKINQSIATYLLNSPLVKLAEPTEKPKREYGDYEDCFSCCKYITDRCTCEI
jgi:hypothetical protein